MQDLSVEYQERPDFYNPIWISVTLIFSIGIFSNIAIYIALPKETVFHFQYSLVMDAFATVIGLGFFIPLIFWLFLILTGIEKSTLSLVGMFSLYNYANLFFIFSSVVAIIPISIIKWLSFGFGCLAACKFLAVNYASFLTKLDFGKKNTAIFIILGLEILAALLYKTHYFAPIEQPSKVYSC